jgi:cAMP-dependent protein kinase regulator
LKNYEAGDVFGELALLYNAPRAATITAKTEAMLWSLDRATFNAIVKNAAAAKRNKYEEFLAKVKILSEMELYERSKLADAIHEKWFNKGEYIIREGDIGDDFYMLMSGFAKAMKTIEPGKPPQEVFKYTEGDYFGEKALLSGDPRAASIIAESE